MGFLDVVNNWDEKSLQALYDNYYKALVGFSYTIVGSVEMAEDVVQDVLVNVWQKKVVFTSEARIKSYLYTSVHNSSVSSASRKANNMCSMSQVRCHLLILLMIGERNFYIRKSFTVNSLRR